MPKYIIIAILYTYSESLLLRKYTVCTIKANFKTRIYHIVIAFGVF